MFRKILEEKPITIAQAKAILEGLGREPNQFQRRALEYAAAFSKLSAEAAEKAAKELVEKFGLGEREAIQIVNCMPESIEELRVFFPRHKIVETSTLEEMLATLDKYRGK